MTQQTPIGFQSSSSHLSDGDYPLMFNNEENNFYGKERADELAKIKKKLESESSEQKRLKKKIQKNNSRIQQNNTNSNYKIHQGNSWAASSSSPSLDQLDDQIQKEIDQIGALKKQKFEEMLLTQNLDEPNIHHTIFGKDSAERSSEFSLKSKKYPNKLLKNKDNILEVSPSTIYKQEEVYLAPEEENELAKLYENFQEEKVKKANTPNKKRVKNSKYSHIKSKVYDVANKKITKKIENIDKNIVIKDRSKSRTKIKKRDGENVEDRLLKYGKEKIIKYEELKMKRQKENDNIINKEIRLTPKISKKSSSIVKKMNRGHFSNPYERLFFKGIEQNKKKQEKAEQMFKKNHPFAPEIKNSDKSKLFNKKVNYDKLYRAKEEHHKKMELLRYFHQNYDMKTGQALFQPTISQFDREEFLGPTWKEMEAAKNWTKQLRQKCRIIFKFLDPSHSGFVSARSINYNRMHGNCVNILSDLLVKIIQCPYELNFNEFYRFVLDEELVDLVEGIFAVVQSQPKVVPSFRI